MKIIEKNVNIDAIAPEGYLFIDIETTGLAKENSNIYLVGVAHYVDSSWFFKQWLLESPMEEAQALEEIAFYLKDFDTLVHFNGDRFDLPFLDYHARLAGVDAPYLAMKSLDIYKKIKCCKSLFMLESAKQKSFEVVVGNDRKDMYGGGELIKVYYEYLASLKVNDNAQKSHKKVNDNAQKSHKEECLSKCGDEEKLHFLLLHNEEDVLGMITLVNLLPYGRLYDAGLEIIIKPPKVVLQDENEILLQFSTKDFYKYKISRRLGDGIYLALEENILNLKIPLKTCEMKYFFPHPDDYYYLPKEDMAVHKSVGAAVDPNFRIKANKEKCYVRKTGSFIKLNSTDYAPIYRQNYGTQPYTLLHDKLLQDTSFWNFYLKNLFDEIKKDCYIK